MIRARALRCAGGVGLVLVVASVLGVLGGCRRPGKGGPAASLVPYLVLAAAGVLRQLFRAAVLPAAHVVAVLVLAC